MGAHPLTEIEDDDIEPLIIYMSVLLVVTLFAAWRFARQLVRPLEDLEAGAVAVARGQFPMPWESTDRGRYAA